VLETLRAQPEPAPLSVLADLTGLHVNTLRGHLQALEDRGLVDRRAASPRGRGRPAWTYRATAPADRSEYAGLASALAAAIHRTSRRPRAAAIEAGTSWGRDLAREHGRPRSTSRPAARRAVIALLDQLGFAPRADRSNASVRLTRCPLLEAATHHPDVVCGVHLGIVRGALEEYGVPSGGSDLHPFSEPGACRLELLPERARPARG
jgi:predicted ArsR family transcriptional regulator